ncbi:17879_t:CDS:2, partial [Acaulospora morrowiae]
EMLFGRKKTPAELLRIHQRTLQKAQREMERERSKLEISEKKLIADIKKSAKANQMAACKIMAKDLVRTRRYIQKFQAMKTQLQAVNLQIQTLRSNQAMSEAMRGATKVIVSQVLDEIGISLDQSLIDAPSSVERTNVKEKIAQAAEMDSSNDAALQARLDNLRRE